MKKLIIRQISQVIFKIQLLGCNLFTISLWLEPWRRSSTTSLFSASDSNDMGVNSARDTIVHLDVKLGKSIFLEDGSFSNVTGSSVLDHVLDQETFDCLVFWDTTAAIQTTDRFYVASTGLVSAVIASFLGLLLVFVFLEDD